MKNYNQSQTKLFWIDLEMTGLDVEKEVIIECAVVITDYNFTVLDTYHSIINQPSTYLDRMDQWNREHHGASGLLQKIPFGETPEKVEQDLLDLLKKHWPKIEKKEERPILAGNSVMQDRMFLDKYFKDFAKVLHYRQLDVSSWKIIYNNKFGLKYEKKNAHRALDDILESIEEMKHYLKYVRP